VPGGPQKDALTPGLIAAIALALLHDGFGLRSAIGRQRATDIGLSGRELSFSAADITLVALVRLDQLARHSQSPLGFLFNISFGPKVPRDACLDCERCACPSFPGAPELNHTYGISTLVRRLLAGRTIFLGPEAEQSFVQLILFHLSHAPTPVPGLDFV
jgi:hypothetical protein